MKQPLQDFNKINIHFPQKDKTFPIPCSIIAEKAMALHSSTLAWKIHGQGSLVGCSPWGR